MANVKVLSRVKHDGVRYTEGEVIANLTSEQAKQLIDSGEAVKAGATDKPSKGTKVDRKPSRIKESLLAGGSTGDRKTVSEKAQERQQKSASATSQTTEPKEPATDEDSGQDEGTAQDETGGDTLAPAGVQDDPEASEFSFTAGEDSYTRKNNKNGVPQYRKNGQVISKVDFLQAQQAAGEGGE